MTTTTTVTVSATPQLRVISMRIEGRSGEALSYDWLDADGELRGAASKAPQAGGYTKVHTIVTWHDGLEAAIRIDFRNEDETHRGNLLVDRLRDQALMYLGREVPGGWTAETWSAHLTSAFGEHLPALRAKWSKVLERLPAKTEAAANEVDIWGGEDAAAALPAVLTPANDAAPAAAKPQPYEPQGRGFVGSKHVAGRDTAETAALIRTELRGLAAKGTPEIPQGTAFRVRTRRFAGGTAIDVAIVPPDDFVVVNEARVRVDMRLDPDDGPTLPLLTEQARVLADTVETIRKSYGYDNSDTMIDYFDVDFYGSSDIDWDVRNRQRKAIEERLRGGSADGGVPWTGKVSPLAVAPEAPAFRPKSDKLPAAPLPKQVVVSALPYVDPIPVGPVAEQDLPKLLKVEVPYKKGRLEGTFTLHPRADRGMWVEFNGRFCGKELSGSLWFEADGKERHSGRYFSAPGFGEVTNAARDATANVGKDLALSWSRAHPEAFVAAARVDAASDVARTEGEIGKLLKELDAARAKLVEDKARLISLGGPLPSAES